MELQRELLHSTGGRVQSAEAPFALSCTERSSAAWLSPFPLGGKRALHTVKRIGTHVQQLLPAETGLETARTCLPPCQAKAAYVGVHCNPTHTLCCRDAPTRSTAKKYTNLPKSQWVGGKLCHPSPTDKHQANPKPLQLLSPLLPGTGMRLRPLLHT